MNYVTVAFFLQSWDAFFRNSTAGAAPGLAYQSPPSLAPTTSLGSLLPLVGGSQVSQMPVNEKIIDDHLAVQAIIRSYQVSDITQLHKYFNFFILASGYSSLTQKRSFLYKKPFGMIFLKNYG